MSDDCISVDSMSPSEEAAMELEYESSMRGKREDEVNRAKKQLKHDIQDDMMFNKDKE